MELDQAMGAWFAIHDLKAVIDSWKMVVARNSLSHGRQNTCASQAMIPRRKSYLSQVEGGGRQTVVP